MHYYQITETEYNSIIEKLPTDTAFGVESFGTFFFSSEMLANIDKSYKPHLMDLIFESVFNKSRAQILTERASKAYEIYAIQEDKQVSGKDAYNKIVGYLVANNELGAKIDTEIIPAYESLQTVRAMLLDGLLESALRYWIVKIKVTNLISNEAVTFVEDIFERLCIKYGTTDEAIAAIKAAPEGVI